jgi:hypothetical protein
MTMLYQISGEFVVITHIESMKSYSNKDHGNNWVLELKLSSGAIHRRVLGSEEALKEIETISKRLKQLKA